LTMILPARGRILVPKQFIDVFGNNRDPR